MTTTNADELRKQIEYGHKVIKEHQYSVKQSEALSRLLQNEDFNEVIMKGYLEVYLNRELRDFAGTVTEVTHNMSANRIKSIVQFKEYLINITNSGSEATREIKGIEEEIAYFEKQLAEEELNG